MIRTRMISYHKHNSARNRITEKTKQIKEETKNYQHNTFQIWDAEIVGILSNLKKF